MDMAKSKIHSNLHSAKSSKSDEFYTQRTDIENEMEHYEDHFKGKVVYCNCDDPRVSEFFRYFSRKFEILGLKKLITTCFKNQNMELFSQKGCEQAIYLEYNGDKNGNKKPDTEEIEVKHLKKNGDFRSDEAIALLKQADIVVTNPPFSLFREYIAQLMEYDKKFLIIGNINSISYKECFELIKSDKVWLGYNNVRHFGRPDGTMYEAARSFWYTNLDIDKRHEDLDLYKKYTPESYPKYENYDAINVDKTSDIPKDYDGVMGVPITFMNNYNPKQFEIIGLGISNSGLEVGVQPYKKEHKKYRKEIQKRGAVDGDLYMMVKGEVTVPYARILIRNKTL